MTISRRQVLAGAAGTAAAVSLPLGLCALATRAFIPGQGPARQAAEQVLAGLALVRGVPLASVKDVQRAAQQLSPGEVVLSLLGPGRTRLLQQLAPHAQVRLVSAGERFQAPGADEGIHLALWSACEQAAAWARSACGPRSATLAFAPEALTDAAGAWHLGFERAGGSPGRPQLLTGPAVEQALATAAAADVVFALASGADAVTLLRAAHRRGLTSRLLVTGWTFEAPLVLAQLRGEELEGLSVISTWQHPGPFRSGRAALGERVAAVLRGASAAAPLAALWRFDAGRQLHPLRSLGPVAPDAAHLALDWSLRSGGLHPYLGC